MAETEADAAGAAGATTFEPSDFEKLLQEEIRPRTKDAEDEIKSAVQILAEQAVADGTLIKEDVLKSIDSMVRAIDEKLT
ncbi:MAG: type VI secretion system contractile sheath large subunit, partial [Pseudomonadota bacterium]